MRERISIKKKKKSRQGIPSDVNEKIKKGMRFIPLEDALDEQDIPEGWAQSEVKVGDSTYFALMPIRMFVYIGDSENSDELLDLYHDIEKFENGLIANHETNAGSSWLAEQVREAYSTAKLNDIIDTSTGKINSRIQTRYAPVMGEIKALAQLATGDKSLEESDLSDLIEHVNPIIEIEKENVQVRERVKCYAGSHWEYRDKMHNVTIEPTPQIKELENKVIKKVYGDVKGEKYTQAVNDLRTYTNTTYIMKKHPDKCLPMEVLGNGRTGST